MDEMKQLTLVGNETPEQAEAIGLHYEIVSAAQAAASSLLDLGRKLKRMRDSGKYQRAVKHIRVITCAKCKYWATVDCPLYGENTADDFCSKAEKWRK